MRKFARVQQLSEQFRDKRARFLADFDPSSRNIEGPVLPQSHGKVLVDVLHPPAWLEKSDALNEDYEAGATPERRETAKFLQ